jgi:antitoxin (DNA-binding transcriptional repressor) of toxin-antitoxin stability system
VDGPNKNRFLIRGIKRDRLHADVKQARETVRPAEQLSYKSRAHSSYLLCQPASQSISAHPLHITVHHCSSVLLSSFKVRMKTLSFTEFRKKASEILRLVEKGETVRVLRQGKVIAKIIPADTGEKTLSWKRPGLRLAKPGASLSRAILKQRRKSR